MWKWFTAVDTDRSGKVTAVELQQALTNGNHTSFDISTIEMLMRLFVCVKPSLIFVESNTPKFITIEQDSDNSGTITFHEFQGIFKVRGATYRYKSKVSY
jgi:Ca2+-binding EF-hand superfamily protein